MKLSIFNFTDYHRFLYEYCKAVKALDSSQTHRSIAAAMGIKSAGHLSLIMQGKANISNNLAEKIAGYCKFKKQERSYFHALVAYNQAGTHQKKRRYFEQVISFPKSCVYRVGSHQYKYYDKWYHSVIRAVLEYMPVKSNFAQLARVLIPSIRPDQAQRSIELLAELGMIQKDADGFYRPAHDSIDTGSKTPSVVVNSFILEMIDRAKEAMDTFDRSERNFAWTTVGVSEEGYQKIVEEMRAFRLRVAHIVKESPADRVYQINMQAFPVTKKRGGKR